MGLNITIGGLNLSQWQAIAQRYKISCECGSLKKRGEYYKIMAIAKANAEELEKELKEFQ